jgi:DNA-binding MarR family transcriptional regulator
MAATADGDALTHLLRVTILDLVRRDSPDLTARQFGAFLTVYLAAGPHTVRGLAAQLNVSKPAITRALDRLGELDLVRRKLDPQDRRSVLVQQTQGGRAFLAELRRVMAAADTERRTAVA